MQPRDGALALRCRRVRVRCHRRRRNNRIALARLSGAVLIATVMLVDSSSPRRGSDRRDDAFFRQKTSELVLRSQQN